MIVLLDLGNSRLKVAGFSIHEAALHAPSSIDYQEPAQLEHWLTKLPRPIRRAVGISVVATERQAMAEAALALHDCTIQWLDAQTPTPAIHSQYQQQQLGPDRWFGLLGALRQFSPQANQALVYCSFGTATTIDTLVPHRAVTGAPTHTAINTPTSAWAFLGGLILPGPYLMYQSLNQHTARLGLEPGALHDFPRDTRSAIRSGICRAQLGALWRQCHQAQAHCPEQPVLLVCAGGGWPLMQEALEQDLARWPQQSQMPAPQLRYGAHTVLHGLAHHCAQNH